MSQYLPTIGIECHVQLKTKTKLFSAVANDARTATPNSLISHIDVGLPGALPVLNAKALELAVRAGLALGAKPQKFSKFDRKHYFYPDLPKGYQITQYEQPVIVGGQVEIVVDGKTSVIVIDRVHLEEDAGKNIHPAGADYSLVDLNRAGTPLLEIVSQPQLHSPAEAKAYVRELYLLMKYADVSDVDLFHGNMRFDVNVSVSKDKAKPGIRTEVKNLNSFRSVEAAVDHEIKRQIEILEKGGQVTQETRGWDEAKQKTTAQRGKEEAHDYRYMPEPDIPPVVLDQAYINRVKQQLPELPVLIRQKLNKLSIQPKVIEDILDRPSAVEVILSILDEYGPDDARRAAFWLLQHEPAIEDDPDYQAPQLDIAEIHTLSEMVANDELSSTSAKAVFAKLMSSGGSARQKASEMNLLQISDKQAIEKVVQEVIDENQTAADDVRRGEHKAIGYLVGQVMAKTGGQANPALAKKIIKKLLGL